jgi:hypothetical protein
MFSSVTLFGHHKRANGAYSSTNTSGYKGPTTGIYFVDQLRVHIEQFSLINGFGYQGTGLHVRDTTISSTIHNCVFLGALKGLDYELKYSIDDFALQTTPNVVPNQYRSPRAVRQGLGVDFNWLPNFTGFSTSYYSDTGNYVGAGNPFAALIRLCTQAFQEGRNVLNFGVFGFGGGIREHHYNARISLEASVRSASLSVRYCVFGPREPVGAYRDRPNYQNYRPRYSYIAVTGGSLSVSGNTFKGSEKFVVPRTLTSSYVEFDLDGIGGGDDAIRINTITLSTNASSGSFGPWINETVNGVDSLTSVGFCSHFMVLENCSYTMAANRSVTTGYIYAMENVSNSDSLYNESRSFVYTNDLNSTRLDDGSDDLYVLHPTFSDRDFTGQKVGLVFVNTTNNNVYDGTSGKTIDNLINDMYNGLLDVNVQWRINLPIQILTMQANASATKFLAAGDSGTSTSNPGEIVTGSTSTATGRVLSAVKFPANNTQYVIVYNVEGTFQSGETVTGSTSAQAWVVSTASEKRNYPRNITSDWKPPYCGKSNRGVASDSDVTKIGPVIYANLLLSADIEIDSDFYRVTEGMDAYNLRFVPLGQLTRGSFGSAQVRTSNGTTITDHTSGGIFRSFENDGNGTRIAGVSDILSYLYYQTPFVAQHETLETGTNNENFLTTQAQYVVNNGTSNLPWSSNIMQNTSGPSGDYYQDVRLNMQTFFIHVGNYPSIILTSGDYVVSGDGRVIYNYSDRYYDALRGLSVGNISKVSTGARLRI